MGFAHGVAEDAVYAPVGAVEQLAAHPFKVERQAQGLAHAPVCQQWPARVQHIALEARGQLVGKFGLDQLAGIKLLAVHAPRPVAGAEKTHQVELAGLQRLQPCRVVLVDLDQHAVEVGRAAAHVQVARPVVGIAHVGDVLAELDGPDLVRPAANGRLHHHLVEGLALAPLAAEHGQAAHGERQLAVGALEAVAHGAFVHHVDAVHVDQHGLVRGRGVRADQGVVAVLHVRGQHSVAIVKARFPAQAEGGRQAIGRHRHVLGQQAVAGALLVQRAGEQGVEHQLAQISRRAAADGEGVVLVEGGQAQVADQAQLAALGRIRVDVVEVVEPGRVLHVAPQRIAVGTPRRGAEQQTKGHKQCTHATILPLFFEELDP